MSLGEDRPKNSTLKLLPHQTALLETFFSPDSKRMILLRGDVGLGKSTVLVALTSRLLQEQPMARVLFLGPKALQTRVLVSLNDAGASGLLVDRYQYRQMLDAMSEGELWPDGTVVVMSIDFAKQPDVQDSLAATRWNLVIVDEAHMLRGARAEVLQRVSTCAERVVLATAILQGLDRPPEFPDIGTTIVDWRRDQIVDQDGKPFKLSPKPILHEIKFSPNSEELRLRETVGDLCENLQRAFGTQDFRAQTLLRTIESSPVALEGAVQRLSERLEIQEGVDPLLEVPDEELSDDRLDGGIDRDIAEKVAGIAAGALQAIEGISIDSKLKAFGDMVAGFSKAKGPLRRICVLTQYLGTLYYLATEIESRGMGCQLLHGTMRAEDRLRSLELFSEERTILVATTAVMTEGIYFEEVTDLILYEVPSSKNTFQQVLGRFNRVGRHSQLHIHVFRPIDTSDGVEREHISALHDILEMQGSF